MDIHRCRFVDYSPHSITSLKFSTSSTLQHAPSDLRLAVGRSNGDIEIWNPRHSWIHEMTLKGGKGRAIEGLAWSQGRLFSIGGSSSVTEWDLKTGLPLINYDCHAATIWSIAATDGKLAAGCDNGDVVIVNISGGPGVLEYEKRLQRQSERVLSVAWKGTQVVGGCADGRIRVWSTRSEDNGRVVATMRVDKSRRENTLVWSVMVLKKQIVSGDSSGSVKFWDGSNFSLQQSFNVHEADVLCLSTDYRNQAVFSAGVDRKIVNYKLVDKRWTNVSNRLLHSQDVRAMAAYEAKDASFLISGGVESSLVITSVQNFMDGMFRKIPITKHKPCVSVTAEPRFITMWEDQTIKIWRIDQYSERENQKGRKLVLKMVLNNEENITHASVKEDGSMIAVATLAEVKIFKLSAKDSEQDYALQVEKSVELDGANLVKFAGSKLIMVTPESELLAYDVNSGEAIELEAPQVPKAKNLPYDSNITHIAVHNDRLVAARHCGYLDVFNLTSGQHLGGLPRVNAPPTALKFTAEGTIIVVTAEIRVLEFNIETRSLTAWSKRNSDLLPRELVSLVDKCCGVFYDPQSPERIWLWGANWLCFIDLGVNISVERAPKRKLDRLSVQEPKQEEDSREEDLQQQQMASPASTSSSSTARPFWITYKYRPMLVADSLGAGEFAVVERPPFNIPLPPAFWSTHKISF